jgi:HK97 family phage prohead protease
VKKSYAFAAVKEAPSEHPNGEFEVVLSAATVDRDGEVIDARAFEPLPESIPFHAFHDFHDPIGRGTPFYDGDVLKARGVYASTARAQEIRTLVAEGIIGHTSVGFMAADRKDAEDGTPHITSGELLEGSFVSVPSNREAAVLAAKSFDAYLKAGSRNSAKDAERLQAIHDLAVDNGAKCVDEAASTEAPATPDDEESSGKSLASEVVAVALTRARLTLLDTE